MIMPSAEGDFTFDRGKPLTHSEIAIGATVLALPVWYEPLVPHSLVLYGNAFKPEGIAPLTGTVDEKADYERLGGGLVFLHELGNTRNRRVLSTHPILIQDGTVVQRTYFFSL